MGLQEYRPSKGPTGEAVIVRSKLRLDGCGICFTIFIGEARKGFRERFG